MIMADIFTDWKLGSLDIPNRLVRSATWEGMADENGAVTPRLAEFMEDLAKNQVGLIISSNLYVAANGRAQAAQAGIHSNDMLPGLSRMVAAVHKHKGIIAAQIAHGGGHTKSAFIGGGQPVGPSPFFNPLHQEQVAELSRSQIEDIIAHFGKAAVRAREAGFDAIELHMAHGYLANQFLNPVTNTRNDEYGQRALFALNVYKHVRQEVGAAFPVFVKINSEDGHEGMQTIDDTLPVAQELDKLKVDAIEVSGGIRMGAGLKFSELSPSRRAMKPSDEGYFFNNAIKIKERVKCPVISVGGWRSRDRIEEALDHVDAVAMSRPFIAQPDLPRVLRENGKSKCISCDKCFAIAAEQGLACILNMKGNKA